MTPFSLSRATPIAALLAALFLTIGCDKSIDRVIDGELNEESDRRKEDDSRIDFHDMKLDEGVKVSVRMSAETFDTYLQVQAPSGGEVAQNDDCQNNDPASGSCVLFTAPEAGVYRIYANAYDHEGVGPYRLEITEIKEE